jgi:hypothetical protein
MQPCISGVHWLCVCARSDFLLKEAMSVNEAEHKKHTFIIKPDGSCQGKGIFLARDSSETAANAAAMRDAVAQLYVHNVRGACKGRCSATLI